MRNEMILQADWKNMESDAASRTLAERLAAWAAALMQQAHVEVRRYEAARAALGTGTNPLEEAHDQGRAARTMLYGKYFADSIEVA